VVIEAVDEVGNPTILATMTVIAAILPMAFRRGSHGTLHATDSGGRFGRHGVLAAGGLYRHALGLGANAEIRREEHASVNATGHHEQEDWSHPAVPHVSWTLCSTARSGAGLS
jgi:hypothetical protein